MHEFLIKWRWNPIEEVEETNEVYWGVSMKNPIIVHKVHIQINVDMVEDVLLQTNIQIQETVDYR